MRACIGCMSALGEGVHWVSALGEGVHWVHECIR